MNEFDELQNNKDKNQINKEFMELDIGKIREFLKILEEHQEKCEQEGNFVEADMCKQRVQQFKKVEEQKLLSELSEKHEHERNQLEQEQQEEIDKFNQKWDEDFTALSKEFELKEEKLNEGQEEDLKNSQEKFEEKYPKEPKPCAEVLNCYKIMEKLLKKKDYTKAHDIQIKIASLTEKDSEKFLKAKEYKWTKELEVIKKRHSQEYKSFQSKITTAFNELKKKRAMEFDKQIVYFRNILKELENYQKTEKIDFNRPVKIYNTKSNSRFSKSLLNTKNPQGNFNQEVEKINEEEEIEN